MDRNSSLPIRSQPRMVELAGLAGAGKSTLARTLRERSDKVSIGAEIAFREVVQFPSFVRSIPLVLSSVFTRIGGCRRWTWDEIKFLVYLKKWDQVLEQQSDHHPGIILLDHGPIFKMATLHAFGPGWLRTPAADAWWSELFQRWATFLDLIVWLDAPDPFLEVRINGRNQKHLVKGKTGSEVMQFLARYRSSYHCVLAGLAAAKGPNMIQFDTSQASIDEIAKSILAACRLEPGVGQ